MNTLKLYYPSVDRDNRPLDQSISNPIYKALCAEICQVTGGITVYPVSGIYLNSSGKLIQDDISLITTFTDKLDETINIMKSSAMLILKALNQESILIEVNNQLESIRD